MKTYTILIILGFTLLALFPSCEKTDDALKDTFTVSDEAWKQCLEEEKETELAQQKLQGEASTIATSLPGLNRQIKESSQQRNKVSHTLLFLLILHKITKALKWHLKEIYSYPNTNTRANH